MPETKQPTVVQLTDEELAVYGPFVQACDTQIKLFIETMDHAKRLMLDVVLAARAAAGTLDEEGPGSPAPPIVH